MKKISYRPLIPLLVLLFASIILIIYINIIDSKQWYQPKPGITWQWQLTGDIDTSYNANLYDIDLVDTPQAVINEFHTRNIKVICYFSAGTWEKSRDDATNFPKEVLGNTLDNWPDEKWLDISNYENFQSIIEKRLDLAIQKNCDGIEPDNIDGFQNNSGFDLSYKDQLEYNKWLANEAHARKLSIALKNNLDQVNDLIGVYDFAINEECFYYDECDKLLPFIEEKKAVLGVEYELETSEFCDNASKFNFSWLKMDINLNGSRITCS